MIFGEYRVEEATSGSASRTQLFRVTVCFGSPWGTLVVVLSGVGQLLY